MAKNHKTNNKQKWYKKKWIWAIVAVIVVLALLSPTEETKKADDASNSTNASQQAKVPRFDRYLNQSMSEVAKEFGQDYDAKKSTQISVEKNGYKMVFEDNGVEDSVNALKSTPTGKVTTTSITLPELGKCEYKSVYDKIDQAMKLAGLDPASKGERNQDNDGTTSGDAEFNSYLDKESLRLINRCPYEGAEYQLIITVLPQYRVAE